MEVMARYSASVERATIFYFLKLQDIEFAQKKNNNVSQSWCSIIWITCLIGICIYREFKESFYEAASHNQES